MSVEQPPSSTFVPPVIDPHQTKTYSWKEYNSRATILYVRDHEQANEELSKLDVTVLGFDIEWKPKYYKGGKENRVALVQLASYHTILLLQISAMEEFPSKLAEILANSDIVKTGVAIQSDALKLYNDYRVSICNCVDLSLFARTVDNAHWRGKYTQPLGLARLIGRYERRNLVKVRRMSCSNWEAELSNKQQESMMPMQDLHFTGNLKYFCLYYQLLRSAYGIHLMPLTVGSLNKMVHDGVLKPRIMTLDRLHHWDVLEKLKPR